MRRRARFAGITDIVMLPEGVGVVGTTVEATQAAKRLLKVTWSNAPGTRHDSERALGEFAEIGRDKSRGGVVYDRVGDAKAAMAGAARVFRGEYRTRYLYHAQMEPLSATAAVSPDGKSAEIWAGTQGPTNALNQVARLLKTERSKHHAASAHAGRRIRPPQPAGGDRRGGAPRQGGRQAGEADLEPRGRSDLRQVPPDDRASHRGRVRRRRQADRLASPRGVGVGHRLHVGRSQSRAPTGS